MHVHKSSYSTFKNTKHMPRVMESHRGQNREELLRCLHVFYVFLLRTLCSKKRTSAFWVHSWHVLDVYFERQNCKELPCSEQVLDVPVCILCTSKPRRTACWVCSWHSLIVSFLRQNCEELLSTFLTCFQTKLWRTTVFWVCSHHKLCAERVMKAQTRKKSTQSGSAMFIQSIRQEHVKSRLSSP